MILVLCTCIILLHYAHIYSETFQPEFSMSIIDIVVCQFIIMSHTIKVLAERTANRGALLNYIFPLCIALLNLISVYQVRRYYYCTVCLEFTFYLDFVRSIDIILMNFLKYLSSTNHHQLIVSKQADGPHYAENFIVKKHSQS